MPVLERPSPNHGPRFGDWKIDMLIIHYTGMQSAAAALDRLCDPVAQVSAHYVIEENGLTWQLVPEERRAWHAGQSGWVGRTDINSYSIGIELVNPGHEFGYRPFPEAQIAALEELSHAILGRHLIVPRFVLGHSDVAPHRKMDPGELFDWARLAQAGVGFWPDFNRASGSLPPDVAGLQHALAVIGYDITRSGVEDERTRQVVTAFQRHFRPQKCDGILDDETKARVAILAAALAETPPV